MNPFQLLDPAVLALHRLVVSIADLTPWPDAGAAAALVIVTLTVRTLLLPLAVRTLRTERIRAGLAPQLAELQRRHRDDPRRLLEETARVHREAGVSAGSTLLPVLVQLPVIATVYRLVVVPVIAGQPNLVLATHLFGAPLAAHWTEVLAAGGMLAPGAFALLILLAALTALAVVSARETARRAPEAPALLRLLPFGTVVFALISPVAVGIYLLATTSWTVAERHLLPRFVPA